MARWILRSDGEPPIILRMPLKGIKTIGRTARADFIVTTAMVSRLHCRLSAAANGQLTVLDLGSTNGTRVNGEKIERATLKAGDRLKIGRLELMVSNEP